MFSRVKTYIRKPVKIKAMKFAYNSVALANMREFVGAALINFQKDESMTAVATMGIQTNAGLAIASEGDYIVLDDVTGTFCVYGLEDFHQIYTICEG